MVLAKESKSVTDSKQLKWERGKFGIELRVKKTLKPTKHKSNQAFKGIKKGSNSRIEQDFTVLQYYSSKSTHSIHAQNITGCMDSDLTKDSEADKAVRLFALILKLKQLLWLLVPLII